MKKLLGITLGVMTALGGFVDLGQIVFTLQAGALFGYELLWAIVLGTAAIIVYMAFSYSMWLSSKDFSSEESTSQPLWVMSTSSSMRTPPSPGR